MEKKQRVIVSGICILIAATSLSYLTFAKPIPYSYESVTAFVLFLFPLIISGVLLGIRD